MVNFRCLSMLQEMVQGELTFGQVHTKLEQREALAARTQSCMQQLSKQQTCTLISR